MRKIRVPVPELPKKKYKITVKNTGQSFEADPANMPYSKHGIPGSILDIVSKNIDDTLIEHACGGVQACSTCHIYVQKGTDSCNEASEREEDYVEKARAVKMSSRLACCCVPDGSEDIEIEIPSWNINLVKEHPH